MKTITLALAALAIASTASAASAATQRVADMDYLKAKRCQGLAEALGETQLKQELDAFVAVQGRTRIATVSDMGAQELRRAKYQAKSDSAKPRLQAELTGCTALIGEGSQNAAR